MIRNPVIEIDKYKIQLIGDPHFGKSFKASVGSKAQYRIDTMKEDFIKLMNNTEVDKIFVLGDLFDKFNVTNNILLDVYNFITKAIESNTNIQYVLIPGNHDLSKDSSKVSSYKLLEQLLSEKEYDNLVLVKEHTLLEFEDFQFLFDCYNPFYEEVETDYSFLDINLNKDLYVFGHFDDPRSNSGYLPNQFIRDSAEIVYSGHIHTPSTLNLSVGTSMVYIGSMQPYTHAEDPEEMFYKTYHYRELENLFKEKGTFGGLKHQKEIDSLATKNVRVSCYPGYLFPYTLDCLSFIYHNVLVSEQIDTHIEEEELEPIIDFTTLYLLKLKILQDIPEDTIKEVYSYLKEEVDSLSYLKEN